MASKVKAGEAYIELLLQDKIARGLSNAQKKLNKFGTGVLKISAGISALGAGIIVPLLAATQSFSDTGDKLAKLSDTTGITIETLSALSFAASQSSVDFSILQNGILKSIKVLRDGKRELSTVVEAFEDMGLSLDSIEKMNADEKLLATFRLIRQIPDPTQKAAIAMELLGKKSAFLVPLIDHMDELTGQAEELGLVMSTKDARAAVDFADAMDLAGKSTNRISQIIGASLAPTLTKLLNAFSNVAKTVSRFIDNNREMVKSIAYVGAVLVGIGTALAVVGISIIGLGAVMGSLSILASTLAASLVWVKTVVIAVGGAFISFLVTPIGLTVTALTGLVAYFAYTSGAISDALDYISGRFSELQETGTRAFSAIMNAISVGDLQAAGDVLYTGFALAFARIKAVAQNITNEIRYYFDNLWYTVMYGVTKASVFVNQIWAGVVGGLKLLFLDAQYGIQEAWNGISSGAIQVVSSISTAFSGMLLYIKKLFWKTIEANIEAFSFLLDKIATAGYALHIIDDAELKKMEEARSKLDNFNKDMAQEKTGEYEAALKAQEEAAEKQKKAALEQYLQKKQILEAERNAGREGVILDALKQQKQAYAELEAAKNAIAQAALDRPTADNSEVEAAAKAFEDAIKAASEATAQSYSDTADKKIQEIEDATDETSKRALSSSGTFLGSLAGRSLGASLFEERTAKATEETAKNTKKLIDRLDNVGMNFA